MTDRDKSNDDDTSAARILGLPANRDELYPSEHPRVRLANSVRAVMQSIATSTADDEAVSSAVELVERAARQLADGPHGRAYHGSAEGSLGGVPSGFQSHSPVTGPLNPLAGPVRLTASEREVVAEVTYGDAYEGPPGHVHGGVIAALFDEVLGLAQALSGHPGMTGRLEISYRSPTPLHTPLRVTGRFDRVEGRKIFTSGEITAGDRLCAEAVGLFITIDFSKLGQAGGRAFSAE
jgi:acyl-coenzyme A thioesterase PaaI-like protein